MDKHAKKMLIVIIPRTFSTLSTLHAQSNLHRDRKRNFRSPRSQGFPSKLTLIPTLNLIETWPTGGSIDRKVLVRKNSIENKNHLTRKFEFDRGSIPSLDNQLPIGRRIPIWIKRREEDRWKQKEKDWEEEGVEGCSRGVRGRNKRREKKGGKRTEKDGDERGVVEGDRGLRGKEKGRGVKRKRGCTSTRASYVVPEADNTMLLTGALSEDGTASTVVEASAEARVISTTRSEMAICPPVWSPRLPRSRSGPCPRLSRPWGASRLTGAIEPSRLRPRPSPEDGSPCGEFGNLNSEFVSLFHPLFLLFLKTKPSLEPGIER